MHALSIGSKHVGYESRIPKHKHKIDDIIYRTLSRYVPVETFEIGSTQ